MTLTPEEINIIAKLFHDFTLLSEFHGSTYAIHTDELALFKRLADYKERKPK